MDNKTLNNIKKLADGFEYEETQTFIEETAHGTKKRIVRVKKYYPPNLNAIKYLEAINNKTPTPDELEKELRKLMEESNENRSH